MSEINPVSLLNVMRSGALEAQGKTSQIIGEGAAFNNVFMNALNHVSELQQTSDASKAKFEIGDPSVSIGQVMIDAQKANIGFEATMRVRNKVVQAYQDIMNMPL